MGPANLGSKWQAAADTDGPRAPKSIPQIVSRWLAQSLRSALRDFELGEALDPELHYPASCPFTVVIILPASGNSSRAALYHMVQGQRLPPDEAL